MLRKLAVHYLQGMLMGGADVIPGVSGGTMALIVGIYVRLVDTISDLFAVAVNLIRFNFPEARRRFMEVEWSLILPLGLGIGTAILLAAQVILTLMENYPEEMRGLFFGLVAASIAVPWVRIGKVTPQLVVIALVGALIAFFLVGLPFLEVQDPSLIRVFFSASFAICAMILPGISGAFILHTMGMYEPTLTALNNREILYVLVFIAGAGIGLGLFSTLLDWLLENYHDRTMAALVGLMAGSLRAIWPWMGEGRVLRWPGDGDPVAVVVLLLLAGFAFVSFLTWLGARKLEQQGQRAPQTS